MVKNPRFHIVMYPWSAFGHMIPYLHLSNELAERGHNITFILPKKVQSQLQHLNLHPTLISFHSLTIPYVDGLPPGAETASDVPISLHHLLATAMDRTTDQVEAALRALKSDFLFYDTAYWAPPLASKLGMKPIFYSAVSVAAMRFRAVSSVTYCLSAAVISNTLFKRTKDVFSTHSTTWPLLSEPALSKNQK